MKPRSDIESFLNTMGKLKGSIIVVEGKRDELALRNFGIDNIVKISGKPLYRSCLDLVKLKRRYKNKEVIILTDFDREGRKLASRLRLLLQRYKIHPNSRLRKEIMGLGKNKIEDLKSWTRIKEDDYYGKIGTHINKVCNKGAYKGKGSNRKA